MRKAIAAALLLVCAVPHPSLAAPAARAPVAAGGEPHLIYTIRAGDNLYTLAQAYLVHLSDYREVQRLNRIRNPYRLAVGHGLMLPRRLLRTAPLQARIIAFRGQVAASGRALRQGDMLGEGATVETGGNAFVSLGLADGSTVTLPSQSSVRIERLRRVVISNEIERVFVLEAGRSQSRVTPMHTAGDRFEMRTRSAVAAVRGTDFRVAVLDEGRATSTELLGGSVALGGAGAETTLQPGQGAKVTALGLTQPIALLPPPSLSDPGRPQSDQDLRFKVEPAPAAVRYRVQVATDAGFLDLVEEATGEGDTITLPSVPNGDYFVRITAIDANDLEGRPRVYSFDRYLNAVRTRAEQQGGGRRYLFRWQDIGEGSHHYRFVLASVATPAIPLIDQPALLSHSFVALDLPPGEYVWRLQTTSIAQGRVRSSWSEPQALTVSAPTRRH
jgi:hypothetical protein